MDVRSIGFDVFRLDLGRKAKILPDHLPMAASVMFFGSGKSTGFRR